MGADVKRKLQSCHVHRTAKRGSNRRSGQALVEFVPSVLVFLLVVSAAVQYFRYMSQAISVQEVLRNAAFSVINNSGTLTTTDRQQASGVLVDVLGVSLSNANARPTTELSPCIVVSRRETAQDYRVFGLGTLAFAPFSNSIRVLRGVGGSCTP
jgi:Flp pilus assembly protein TadG